MAQASGTTPMVVLTGGIGSGKSSVGQLWARWGAHVVDADELAREVVAPGTVGLQLVVAEFGIAVLSAEGTLNRAALADLVFGDPTRLMRLEEIIHPLVHKAAVERLKAHPAAALVVYEVPLPRRTAFLEDSVVVVVDAPDQTRRSRLLARGLSEDQVAARMASQPSRDEWLKLAAHVVDNSRGETELMVETARLWRDLTGAEAPV